MLNPLNIINQNTNVNTYRNIFPQTNPIQCGFSTLKADIFEHNVSNISFTSVDNTKVGKAIRELGGVPCPYTGIPMINGKEISHLNKTNLSTSSEKAIKLLKPFKSRMHPVEKEVFTIIEELSAKQPKKNMRELLDTVRDEHLDKVKLQEYDILNRMSKVKLENEKDKEKLNALIGETVTIIDKQDENYIFRRRKFIEKLNQITSTMKNEKEAQALTDLAEEIPRAHDNVSSFIVKFTQKDPKTKKEKTPFQIGISLVQSSVGSIEHIKPRNPIDGSTGGKDELPNYLYASRSANVGRKNMPLDKFIEKNPEIKKNMQKYIDVVIDKINRGKVMKDFKAYPLLVAKTVEQESKGLIKLDTSRLNVSKKDIEKTLVEAGIKKPRKPRKLNGFSAVA